MRSRRLTILVSGFLLSTAGAAFAQDARPEVSGGYRYLYVAGTEGADGTSVPKGWYVDVAYPITPMLSIVGDVGGHYKSESETFSQLLLSSGRSSVIRRSRSGCFRKSIFSSDLAKSRTPS